MGSDKVRKSSTKGRHIVQVNPLAKGQSCSTCRQRKVRCSADRPACAACLRTARFEGKDLSTIHCDYETSRAPRGSRKKKEGTVAERSSEYQTHQDKEQHRQVARGSMADLLNGSQGGEAASNSIYPLPLPNPLPGFRVANPTRSNSWESANSSGAPPHLSYPPYSNTPPLSFSSTSSPEETVIPSPPSSIASPALDTWGQAPIASTSSTPYPYSLPPIVYPSSNGLLTSTPLQSNAPSTGENNPYFANAYPQLPPLTGRYPVGPSAYPLPSYHYLSYPAPSDPISNPSSKQQAPLQRSSFAYPLLPSPSTLAQPTPTVRAQPPSFVNQAFPAPDFGRSGASAGPSPTDPTFSLPFGYPNSAVQKEIPVSTPGFNDIDSWLCGLAS